MAKFTYQDREAKAFFVPAGDYILGVKSAVMALSKSSGNEQIELQLEVVHGPKLKPDQKGVTIYDYLIFGEKTDWKIDLFLKACKRQPKKGEVLDINDEWLDKHVVGALLWAQLVEDEYQGKKKNKIGQYLTNMQEDPYKLFVGYMPTGSEGDEL